MSLGEGFVSIQAMGVHITEKESVFAGRRKKILRHLKGSVAIFVSPPAAIKSRDQEFPFFPNTDFFYLTGFQEPESVLLLFGTSKGTRSILYLRERREAEERWTGERLGLKRAKRKFLVDEVRDITNFAKELPGLLRGYTQLYYAPGTHQTYDNLIWSLFRNPVAPRIGQLHTLKDSRLLTAEMRLIKDRLEIQNIRHAVDITARAICQTLRELKSCASEHHAASLIESHFSKLGAEGPAFETIVASGRNATTLHHKPGHQPLWKREFVLFDVGALYKGYAGDITRTVPASGVFSTPQAEVYDVVAEALAVGLSKSYPGGCLDDIHHATIRSLTSGMLSLGILKGNVHQLVAQKAYLRYYMHQTSHWLGLDVHDISPTIAGGEEFPSSLRPLQSGMVFTIEPGLYFAPDDETIPKQFRGIGIRLEEDVLITNSGHEVLSRGIPIAREDICALF